MYDLRPFSSHRVPARGGLVKNRKSGNRSDLSRSRQQSARRAGRDGPGTVEPRGTAPPSPVPGTVEPRGTAPPSPVAAAPSSIEAGHDPYLLRPETDPGPSELGLGITHGVDGSMNLRSEARGVPAILSHTHVLTILIVMAGFVAMAGIFGWVLHEQLSQHPAAVGVPEARSTRGSLTDQPGAKLLRAPRPARALLGLGLVDVLVGELAQREHPGRGGREP